MYFYNRYLSKSIYRNVYLVASALTSLGFWTHRQQYYSRNQLYRQLLTNSNPNVLQWDGLMRSALMVENNALYDEIYDKLDDKVVSISLIALDRSGRHNLGFGGIVSVTPDRCLVLTSYHLIGDISSVIIVLPYEYRICDMLADPRYQNETIMTDLLQGRVVYADQQYNLALIELPATKPDIFNEIPIATDLKTGDDVMLIGRAMKPSTLSDGIVLTEKINKLSGGTLEYLSTSALPNDYSYTMCTTLMDISFIGGPVVDQNGSLVGVCSTHLNLTYCAAIKLDDIRQFLHNFQHNNHFKERQTERRQRSARSLGLIVQYVNNNSYLIKEILHNAPDIVKNTIRENDIIVSINQNNINSIYQLKDAVHNSADGIIELNIRRDGIEGDIFIHFNIDYLEECYCN